MSIATADVQQTGPLTGRRAWRWALRGAAVIVVACTFAAALASAGAWLDWRGADPLPSDQRAGGVAAEIMPGVRIDGVDRYDVIFGDRWPDMFTRLIADDEYDGGSVVLTVNPPVIATV